MLHHTRTFEEKRLRSKSAGPSRQFRKTDIFNTELTSSTVDAPFSSEYKKSFAWPKKLVSVDEENLNKRLNPIEKTHAAGLSSKQCAATNKAHVIENSNGSRSIVIGVESGDNIDNHNYFAFTTGSATNLATMVNTIPQDTIRPLTSMALVDSDSMNKSISSNGSNHSKVSKSVTLTNIKDYSANHEEANSKSKSKENTQIKDTNNNTSVPVTQNGVLDEKLLLEKLTKLNTYESIYGKKAGATTLFKREEIIDPDTLNKIPKKSEYKSAFKPFSTYVYVAGKGWFKPKKIKAQENEIEIKKIEDIASLINKKPLDTSSVKSQETTVTTKSIRTINKALLDSTDSIPNSTIVEERKEKIDIKSPEEAIDEVDALIDKKTQPWYQEAVERRQKANEFRYRCEYGNPVIGRSSLEEVYKRASGYNWQASSDPKFNDLQRMRTSASAFLPYDQHKKKIQEDKPDSIAPQQKIKATTPSKSASTKRATSVPRKKSTNLNSTSKSTTNQQTNTSQPAKVWIKPKAKETITNGDANKETNAIKVQRPQKNNLDKELKQAEQKKSIITNGRDSPPQIQSGPVRTTQIKTPEALSGVRSPPAQNFMDQFDNDPINWTSSTNQSLNSNATYTNLMNEFNPTSIRSDNLADLSGLKI